LVYDAARRSKRSVEVAKPGTRQPQPQPVANNH
jgi:hypothetical protein